MIVSLLRDIPSGLMHLLLPRLCAGCEGPVLREEGALCMRCSMQLPVVPDFGSPEGEAASRFTGRIPFVFAASWLQFVPGGLVQHLLHALKYSRRKAVGTALGEAMGAALGDLPGMSDVDAVIPVPLHPRKEAVRGFNQSALLAAGICAATGKDLLPHLLRRSRETETQTKKSREERLDNVAGAFSLPAPAALTGKHILLVDDVLTTGATLESAARALLQVEAVRVSFATLAIAG